MLKPVHKRQALLLLLKKQKQHQHLVAAEESFQIDLIKNESGRIEL